MGKSFMMEALLRVWNGVLAPLFNALPAASAPEWERVPETEQKWLQCTDAANMLRSKFPPRSDRKLRLFSLAACRAYLPEDLRNDPLLALAEEFAEGKAAAEAVAEARQKTEARVKAGAEGRPTRPFQYLFREDAREAAVLMVDYWAQWAGLRRAEQIEVEYAGNCTPALRQNLMQRAEQEVRTELAHLVRDLVGHPLFPPTIEPEWRSPAVVALARKIYDERAFGRMPELATALANSGCDVADVLDHCRDADRHVRGCWVLDRVLERA